MVWVSGGMGLKQNFIPLPTSYIDNNWNHTQVIVSFQICNSDKQGVMFTI